MQQYMSKHATDGMSAPVQLQEQMLRNGQDGMAGSSTQYAIQQNPMQGISGRHSFSSTNPTSSRAPPAPQRRNTATTIDGDQPVRKRISRACDQCNKLRTKCDGRQPCAHCEEFGLTCEYARERKKRGKASRKDIAAQQAADGKTPGADDDDDSSPKAENEYDNGSETSQPQQGLKRKRSRSSGSAFQQPLLPHERSSSTAAPTTAGLNGTASNMDNEQAIVGSGGTPTELSGVPGMPNVAMPGRTTSIAMSDYGSMDDYHRSMLHPAANVAGPNFLHSNPSQVPPMMPGNGMNNYDHGQFGVPSPGSQQGYPGYPYRTGESPLSAGGFLGQSPPVANSPGWISLPSPSAAMYSAQQQQINPQTLRYPVLRPLLPYITSIIPTGLACDLL